MAGCFRIHIHHTPGPPFDIVGKLEIVCMIDIVCLPVCVLTCTCLHTVACSSTVYHTVHSTSLAQFTQFTIISIHNQLDQLASLIYCLLFTVRSIVIITNMYSLQYTQLYAHSLQYTQLSYHLQSGYVRIHIIDIVVLVVGKDRLTAENLYHCDPFLTSPQCMLYIDL